MSGFWTNPKRVYRLHRVCWGAYKRCWKGGRSPLVSKTIAKDAEAILQDLENMRVNMKYDMLRLGLTPTPDQPPEPKGKVMNTLIDEREEWREWLGKHGLPHNEVEGDMILDFIEAVRNQAKSELLKAIIGVVGDDEVFKCGAGARCDGDMCCNGEAIKTKARNQLRQELRTKFKALFGE